MTAGASPRPTMESGVCAQTEGIPYLICTPGLPRQANARHPFPGKGLGAVCGWGERSGVCEPAHGGQKSPSGGDEVPSAHPREGARLPHEESPTKNRKTSEPRRGFGKRTVRRFIVGFLAEFSWLWSIWLPYAQAVNLQGCQLLFCNLFSFWERKKVTVPPF